MLAMRLSRTGKTAQPSFRVIVQDRRTHPKRKCVEMLGFYLPAGSEKKFSVKEERVKYWISHGARPSDTVAALLKKIGFEGMEKFMEPRDKKRKKRGEASKTEAPQGETPKTVPQAAAPAKPAAPAPQGAAASAKAAELPSSPAPQKTAEPAA